MMGAFMSTQQKLCSGLSTLVAAGVAAAAATAFWIRSRASPVNDLAAVCCRVAVGQVAAGSPDKELASRHAKRDPYDASPRSE